MKIAILLADGFEELEALTPIDILRRAGAEVDTIAIKNSTVCGAHGIKVIADILADEADVNAYGAVIFPGGMPGAKNLDESPFTDKIIDSVLKRGGHLAAICAAPLVLGHRGILKGKKATCFPGFENELYGAVKIDRNVVTDANVTTASGMPAAMDFAKELTALLVSDEAVNKIFG